MSTCHRAGGHPGRTAWFDRREARIGDSYRGAGSLRIGHLPYRRDGI